MMEATSTENHPPRKRLLTDPNPRKPSVTESPESTVSFDSSTDRLTKKTRELPNLSDCHSCGVRINHTNPRERLQPLDSLWRIVLLCKKCTERANRSDLCTYCFSPVLDVNDCFKCSNCQHSVHKKCVGSGPGLGLGLGFTVCVDCWIPDAVAKSFRARKRRFRKKNNESCEQNNMFVEEVKRKVVCAVKASENALRKAVVAKNAVELAKGVLSVVASRKAAGECETKVVDDFELAFLLHRAINSSPRISRYARLVGSRRRDIGQVICYSRRRDGKEVGLVNSSGSDVPLVCYSRKRRRGCLRNLVPLNAPLMCYSRKRLGSKACLDDMECECFICKVRGSTSSAGLKACNHGSNSENDFSGNNCVENDAGRIDKEPHRYLLKYYRIGKGTPRPSVFFKDFDCCSCIDSANFCTEHTPDTRNLGNGNECHEISENFDDNSNRFLLQYKRSSRDNPKFSCKVEGFYPMLPLNHPVEPTTLSSTEPSILEKDDSEF